MSYSEIGGVSENQNTKSLPQLEAELSSINTERKGLISNINNQWPDVPETAISYLANYCPTPEVMPYAISEIKNLLREDPSALSDPDIAPLFLDNCIATATVALQSHRETQNDLDLTNRRNRNEVLATIVSRTVNLKGRAKLEAAIALLNASNIPTTIREELSAKFNCIGKTLDEMSAVFADEASQAVFQSIVNTTSFDLGAPNVAITLAPVLRQVEASGVFSDDQKIRLRQIVTGSDAQHILRETVTDENGISRPRYSQKYQRELRTGVSGYIEGHGRQMIEARAGDRMITKDVTGWSGEDVGLLIETTHMWNMYDSFGVTGFVEDVYKVDFSILGGSNAFDPIQITHLRQVLSHLTGRFEGYDGDIARLSEHKTLIQNQSRLLSETQTALGFENDRSGTAKILRRLGLEDEKGHPNMEVIKSFGEYTRENYGNGAPDQMRLVDYLCRLHPDMVKPLSEIEKATGRLASVSEA